ncbi:hypothetical protein ACROYT_G004338 [Oculina patagonica]
MSWKTILGWNFNATTEQRIIALTKALSPAYVRIGGLPSNFVNFQFNEEERSSPFGKLTIHITGKDLDRINQIAKNAGWQVVFALSAFRRSMDGSWDPSNSFRIVKYAADKGYKFGWELGNEPNHLKNFNANIPPEQLAEDFRTLKEHLSSIPGVKNFLVGPDVTQPRGNAMGYLKGFLEKGHSCIDAVTWHHYYVKALDACLPQFIEPQTLDTLRQDLDEADAVINQVAPNLSKWLGETAGASGGGVKGISDRFVAGFMWLNKLGMAAQHGYKVVIRQTMFQGRYSLVGQDMQPNPDYWLSLLHKRLFGTKVLAVHRINYPQEMVRIFAHCTNTKSGLYKKGAVSFMAMNLHPNKAADITPSKGLHGFGVDEYLFTPEGNITSRKIRLNGNLLELGADSSFPVFQPNPVPPGYQLILPPLTYAFYVIPEAHAMACLES